MIPRPFKKDEVFCFRGQDLFVISIKMILMDAIPMILINGGYFGFNTKIYRK